MTFLVAHRYFQWLCIYMYADDTTLFGNFNDPYITEETLNEELKILTLLSETII